MRSWLLLLACGAAAPRPAPHYAGYDALVDVAATGDLAAAKELARTLGGEDDDARLASALGFAQVAADPAELADAVAAAGQACGDCHAGRVGPARPPFDHGRGARWVAWGLVWNGDLTAPPAEGAEAARVAEALARDGAPSERAAAALAACAGCHAR